MESLRDIRIRRGLSQEDLAELTGVAQKSISDIEIGRREPRPSTLRKLARGLDVEVAEFFLEPSNPLGTPPETALERLRAASPAQLRRLLSSYGDEWAVGRIQEARAVANELGTSYEGLKELLIQVSPLQARHLLVGEEEAPAAADQALTLYEGALHEAVDRGRITIRDMFVRREEFQGAA